MSEQGGHTAHGFWGEAEGDEALQRYRTLVNTIDDGIYQLDADGRFVAVNDVIVDRLGYSRDELLGEHVSKVLDGTDVERIVRAIRQLLETPDDDVVTMEAPAETATGDEVFFELRVNLLESAGEFTGTIGVAREVTDRRERERQLERERNQTEKLLETTPVAVAVSDSEGETIRANQRAQEYLGLSEADLVEGPENAEAWTTYDADGNELADEDLPKARVLETGEPVYDEEIAIEDPSGERRWFRLNAAPVFDEDGELERVITSGEDITELKTRERQLERRKNELETELSEILGRVSDGFFAVDQNWEFTHINDQAPELINPEGVDLEGENVWEQFPDATERKFKEYYERAMDEQVTVSFEGYYPEPLDTWFEVRAYPSETGLSVYFRDVSDRKEREHQLEQYETIVETMNDGIYVKGEDGHFTMVNEAYADMVGYDREELVGAHASLVVDESVIEQSRERLGDTAGSNPTMEARLETADGTTVPTEGTFATVEADGERQEVGVVRDITERREYERDLEARTRQQDIVADLGLAALEIDDPDELMAEAAVRVRRALGTDYAKVLDLDSAADELVLRQGAGWSEYIIGNTTFETGENSQAGYTLLSKEPVVVEDMDAQNEFEPPELLESRGLTSGVSTIIGPFDDPWGILETHDTEQRTYSEEDVNFVQSVATILADAIERERYNTELEELVADLEESNKRLEQFAYAASHDLQEPLRMVSSYLSLIERRYEDVLDEDGQEFLDYAVDGAERMREMIDALLKYSRVDTRGDPFEPVDLESVVESVLSDYQVRIRETNADITATGLPTVYGDEDQLRQVFGNLISNALEYSGDEPPSVRVFAERDGDRWVVGVADEGIGIDAEHEDRVFDVFQRLHTQEEHSGTGIGLALAQRIVERHDGKIWVESEPGEGSTFYCLLPVVEESHD